MKQKKTNRQKIERTTKRQRQSDKPEKMQKKENKYITLINN